MSTSYEALGQLTDNIQSQLLNDVIPITDEDLSILYLNSLTLTRLNESCSMVGKELILKELNGISNANAHQRIKLNLHKIITSINNELFENGLILRKQEEKEKAVETEVVGNGSTTTTTGTIQKQEIIPEQEDISELRKRLFTTSRTEEQMDESNEHHENLQEEVMHDISSLVDHIKARALNFHHALELDKDQVSKLEQNISYTQTLFNLNMINLKQFQKNGRLSYWELIKLSILFLVVILITMFMISIF